MNSFVFQVTSERNVDCAFCGDGVTYIVQCPAHRTQVDVLAQR